MASGRLRVVSGAAAGTEVELNGEFVVGRGEQGSGNLAGDVEISRRHARFRHSDEGHFAVEDLGSTNGTYVNGRRVSAPTVLAPGDEIKLGQTIVRFEDGVERTRVGAAVPGGIEATQARKVVTPAGEQTVARPAAAGGGGGATAPPATPAGPTRPAAPAAPGAGGLPPAGGPLSGPPQVRRRMPKLGGGWRDFLALLGAAAVVVAIWQFADERASASTNCGENIGDAGPVSLVAYSMSNIAEGDNGVLITPYGPDMRPQETTQCLSGGSGATQLTMPGVVDGNDQVVVNEDQTLLFGVNQGSDSIAAFRIQDNGGLEEVEGSPFPSGGRAPSSLGIDGDTLVVSNKAADGVRDLAEETPNYTSFKIAPDGRLTQVEGSNVTSLPGTLPSAAVVPDRGGVAFGLEDGGPIRGMSIDGSGRLSEAPGSPFAASDSAFAEGTPPEKKFALGVRPHPTEDFVYMTYPLAPALAVYRYDDSGRLTFVNSVTTAGAFLPCWIQITQDGRFLYTTSAFTNNVTAFDISNPTEPKQIQDLPFAEPGNAWNIELSPDDRFLFAITPRAVGAVPLGMGNLVHVMEVADDGTLTEVEGGPLELPVPEDAAPYGMAVVAPRGG